MEKPWACRFVMEREELRDAGCKAAIRAGEIYSSHQSAYPPPRQASAAATAA